MERGGPRCLGCAIRRAHAKRRTQDRWLAPLTALEAAGTLIGQTLALGCTPAVAITLLRCAAAVARGVASATPEFAVRAENAEVWDSLGRRYIDFAGGIGVLATGHRHPKVMAAVTEQLQRFTHTSFQVMAYESYIRLAERLGDIAPFSGPAKSLLLTTGVEAVEAAVKIARVATGRTAIIAFSGAFHGRTSLGVALTGRAVPYKHGLDVALPGIFRIPFPSAHRGVSVQDSLRALDLLLRSDVEPSRVAAFIIEPVQGEGGVQRRPAGTAHRAEKALRHSRHPPDRR